MRILIMILVGFSVLWGENFWDNLRVNYRQDGLSSLIGPRDPHFLWRIDGVHGRPKTGVISSDSTLYVHFEIGYLIAIKNDQILWEENFGDNYYKTLCLDTEDLLYFSYHDKDQYNDYYIACYDPKMRVIKWRTKTENRINSLCIDPDGILYQSDEDEDKLSAYNKSDGSLIWSYELPYNGIYFAIGTDNEFYFSHWTNNKLTCFSPPNTFKYGAGPQASSPAISREGNIYSVANKTLYCYKPGLSEQWKTALNDTTDYFQPCAICPDGSIIAVSLYGSVHKVSKDGKYLWKTTNLCEQQWQWLDFPTVDAEGKVFIGIVEGHNCYCINSDGNIDYVINDGGGKCIIGPGRRLYMLGGDLVCYNGNEGFEESEQKKTDIPEKIRIYPNPFKDRLNIELPSEGSIYSITGQLIMKLNKGKHVLKTSNWQTGIYILKSGSNVKRIIKLK